MFACPWKGSPFLPSFPLSSLLPSREMEGSQTCNAQYFTNILLFNHQTAPCEVERGGLARPGLPSWEAVRVAFIFSLLLSLRPPTFPLQLLNSHPKALLTSSISLEAQTLEAQSLGWATGEPAFLPSLLEEEWVLSFLRGCANCKASS